MSEGGIARTIPLILMQIIDFHCALGVQTLFFTDDTLIVAADWFSSGSKGYRLVRYKRQHPKCAERGCIEEDFRGSVMIKKS